MTLEFDDHLGWRGIGVAASTVEHEGFVAVGSPSAEAPEIAISVWVPNGSGARREIAFWIDAEGARKLAAELVEMAEAR